MAAAADLAVSGSVIGDQSENRGNIMGLQRLLRLLSFKTAWTLLHKLCRGMVRSGRNRLTGRVDADEVFVGREKERSHAGQTMSKAMIAVVADGDGMASAASANDELPALRPIA